MIDTPEDSHETPEGAPRRVVRSRRTFWLAVTLGLVACLPFVLVFTRTGTNTNEPLMLTEADQASLKDGLRMLSPSFSGRTEDNEPYTVRAEWALPNGPKPTRISLNQITATITTKDGREAIMTSRKGVFFPNTERLRLTEGVFARTSDGYTVQTPAALIDVKAMTLQTDGEIVAKGPSGSIRADSLEAMDAADRIVIFRGNVRVVFVPKSASQQDSPEQDP